MTMHLVGPYLSTTGKRKGKTKFRNSAEAQKSRALAAEWEALQKKWAVPSETKPKRAEALSYKLSVPAGRATSNHIPSLDTGHSGTVSSKPSPKYTGDKILGIGVLHKSNGVPIFSEEEAIDIAKMRR